MKLGVIAGNRLLPLLLLKSVKEQARYDSVTVICFRGETSRLAAKYADKVYWIEAGHLGALKKIIRAERLTDMVMAGQVNPMRIFRPSSWDKELSGLIASTCDFRPHTIFSSIIASLEKEGARFIDSTAYLGQHLAGSGALNGLTPASDAQDDVDFGIRLISRFVELDVGQTISVKNRSVVALESLEGTDRTLLRGYRLAGKGCTALKFAKLGQDLRFDVPVVGPATLRLLKKCGYRALVLEKNKVIILEKDKFLSAAKDLNMPVIGAASA